MNLIFIIIHFHWLEHFRFFFILTTFITINLSSFLQSTNIFNIHSYILTDSTKYGFTESLSTFFFLHLFLLYKIILKVDKHSFFFLFSLSFSLFPRIDTIHHRKNGSPSFPGHSRLSQRTTQWVGGPLSLLTRAICCYQVLRGRWTIGGGRGRVFHRGRGGTGDRATAQPSHHAFLKDTLIVDPSVHLQRTIYGYVKIIVRGIVSLIVDRLDIDWTHAFEQFGRIFADPSHQLAYPSWMEIHVTCHVEHDSWKLKRNCYVTLFLKVFL